MRSLILLLSLLRLSLTTSQECTATDTCSASPPSSSSLPSDYEDPCRDSHEKCPHWSILGECRANPSYMNENCPRSCGICQPLKLEGVDSVAGAEKDEDGRDVCRDEILECVGYAAEGECLINPDYMRRDNCKYSCWVCVDPAKDRAIGVDEETIAKKLLYADMNLGRPQLIREVNENPPQGEDPMTPAAHDAVRNTIASMEEYAKNVMTAPTIHVKARERCRNEFRMCAEWAARGYCYPAGHPNQLSVDSEITRSKAKDVLFMMNMCPLACQMCEEIPSLACAGKRHPYAKPVMENGGIDKYFDELWENIKHDEKSVFVSHPNSEVEGSENDSYVAVLPDVITEKEADTLIFLGKAIGFSSDGSASCRGQVECTTYKIEQDTVYKQIMERMAKLANTTVDYLESMEIHRHESNKPAGSRHNYQASGVWKPAGPRVLTFQIFLSNPESKGQLSFPHLDWLFIESKKGTVVVWPNVINENIWEMDPLTSYEYFGVDEELYVATVNIRLHNFTDASYRDCA